MRKRNDNSYTNTIYPVHLLVQVVVPAPGTSALAGNLGTDDPRGFDFAGAAGREFGVLQRDSGCRLPELAWVEALEPFSASRMETIDGTAMEE